MNRAILFVLLFFSQHIQLLAQTPADALRYSIIEIGGTARTVAIGGAIGALGADFSVISTNPAGLAAYRSSEVVFSPSLSLINTDSELTGNPVVSDQKNNVNINNIGLVLHSSPNNNRWKTSNFGLGINRLANFHKVFTFEGNSSGSIVDRFLELTNDENGNAIPFNQLDNFEAGLAAETFAIFDPDETDAFVQWTSDFVNFPDENIFRSQTVTTSGSINELVLAYAGNLKDKWMIGGTVGIPILRYQEDRIYREEDTSGNIPFFNNLIFEESLTTTGVGVNFKLGLIYRLNQTVRLGTAIHTPSFYSLNDEYSTSFGYNFTVDEGGPNEENFNNFAEPETPGIFDYRFKTPWRFLGSAGFIIGRRGFISGEVEYLNYGKAKFNLTKNSTSPSDEIFQEELNTEINDEFQSALNIRIGGEYAFNKYRFRAGYIINGTPLADDNIKNNAYSLGIGYRGNNFYIDIAYRGKKEEEIFVPYRMFNPGDEQVVNNTTDNHKFLLTFGYKF